MLQPDDDLYNVDDLEQEYQVGLDHFKHFYFEERTSSGNSFEQLIQIVANSLNDRNINIDGSDLRIIQAGIKHVPNSKFKNAAGYVLGFYITTEKCLDKKKYNNVIKILPELIFPISALDIIRYCRLWCNIVWPKIN